MSDNNSIVIETTKSLDNQTEIQTPPEPLQACASVNDIQSLYFSLNYPSGLSNLANYTIPKNYLDQVKEAKRLRKYDLVDKLLNIYVDYALPVKGVKCKLKKQQKFYDEYVLPLIQRFARQWIVERKSVGEVFPHYGFKNDKIPMYVRLEDLENINVIEFMGFEAYEIKLSSKIKKQIEKLKEEDAIGKLPLYLRKAIKDDRVSDKIILTKSNMYRCSEGKQDYEDHVTPPLIKIAKQIMLRNFLLDLDYVNAFASQKTSIMHVKCGDKETQKMWDKDKIQDMHNLITNRPPGQAWITTRYDVDIKSVDINLNEMFDPKKFEECNANILDFFGLPIVFIPSHNAGVNNTTVIIGLKPFAQNIKTERKIFEDFLKVYFKEINDNNGFSEIPTVEYNFVNVRDSSELIKELQFLKDGGVLSFEELCLKFDYDYEQVKEEKKNDWENRDWQAPTFENSQGLEPLLTKTVDQKIKIAQETKQQNNNQDSSQNNNSDSNLPNNNQTQT